MSFSIFLLGMYGGVSSIAGRLWGATMEILVLKIYFGIYVRFISSYNGGDGLGLEQTYVAFVSDVVDRGLVFNIFDRRFDFRSFWGFVPWAGPWNHRYSLGANEHRERDVQSPGCYVVGLLGDGIFFSELLACLTGLREV